MMVQTALFLAALASTVSAQFTIQPDEFFTGATMGMYDAIIDVRSQIEWDEGHIENATLELNLASMSSIPTTSDILGCEGECETIVVYCRTGARAGVAIQLLLESGFNGTVYNGLGVSQWTRAGYPLVIGNSTLPSCSAKLESNKRCLAQEDQDEPSAMPSSAPSAVSGTGEGLPTLQASDMPSSLINVDSGMPSMEVNTAETLGMDATSLTASPTDEPTSDASCLSKGAILVAVVCAILCGIL